MTWISQKTFFPCLKNDLVYLDTAATSQTHEEVIEVMDRYYRSYRANVHRGFYGAAEQATEAYETSRKLVAEFIGAQPEEVIFTSGATAASNMLVYGLEHTLELQEGDEIVTTVLEHHAMLTPLQQLAKRKGLVMKYAQLGKDFTVDMDDLRELVTDRTRIVAVTAASNVTGAIINTRSNTSINSSILSTPPVIIRDATALVGHVPMQVTDLGADFIFFSGHKMCGPTGIGVLWGRKEWLNKLEPGFYGGGMVDEVSLVSATWAEGVERFEAGTQNIAGVIGLGVAVDYLQDLGMEQVRAHVEELTQYAMERLGTLPGVTLYTAPAEKNVGIISFTVEGVHPHDVAEILGKKNVAVRAGHHCALPLHQALGVPATTRVSFYLYNTKDDVDALVAALDTVRATFAS